MFLFMCLIISKNHSSGTGQGLFIHSYEINQNSDMAAPFLVVLITQSYQNYFFITAQLGHDQCLWLIIPKPEPLKLRKEQMKSYTSLHHRYLHEYAFTSVLKLRLQLCQCFSVSRQHSSFDFRILNSDKSLYQAYKAYVQFLCKFKSILYMFQIYNLCFTKQLGFA